MKKLGQFFQVALTSLQLVLDQFPQFLEKIVAYPLHFKHPLYNIRNAPSKYCKMTIKVGQLQPI